MAKEKFNSLSVEQMLNKKDELTKKLREYRFTSIMGKVENVMEKRTLRRSIALLNTLIHQKRAK